MTVMTYADAAKAALAEEMRRDPLVWAVGEDLGRGGVFGQYKGLVEEFGSERISDAPISEAAIMGGECRCCNGWHASGGRDALR